MNCSAVKNVIVDWLKGQLQISGQKGFVIGISGGVDSALVSTLCALTGHDTYVISLPIHQAPDQIKRGNDHMDWLLQGFGLNVKDFNINLTESFEVLQNAFSEAIGEDGLAMANVRSRLRMVALYAYANHYNLLVAGTGNLVEDYGIGYFSKYGDGGVDLSPIGNLSKSQVWELAKYVGVSDEIVQAKPTDGLWADNRGDEEAIGASYPELEWAMAYCETHEGSIGGSTEGLSEREKRVLSIYRSRHAASLHKMSPIPICKIPQIIL